MSFRGALDERFLHGELLDQWEDIFSSPLSQSEKTDACLAVLRDFVDRLAILSVRAPYRNCRFYTYMLLLYEKLRRDTSDARLEFHLTVMKPAILFLRDWLTSHAVAPNVEMKPEAWGDRYQAQLVASHAATSTVAAPAAA
jgi:hypothetical protein